MKPELRNISKGDALKLRHSDLVIRISLSYCTRSSFSLSFFPFSGFTM